jgi:trans-2-enoyl-CoA reductase
VIVDGDDLAARVARETGDAPIRLGVEAIGGAATGRIVDCVASDATVVHYGSMSGVDPQVGRTNFVYRGVKLTGFMLGGSSPGAARRRSARSMPISASR